MLLSMNVAQVFLAATMFSGQNPPPIPEGLWLLEERGIVVRVERCADAFCGTAVALLRVPKPQRKPEDICGKQMLKDFRWNQTASRWEGRVQPTSGPSLNGHATTDGKTLITLKARLLLISKTMLLIPFTGTVAEECRIGR